jgi:cell division protein FtsQ
MSAPTLETETVTVDFGDHTQRRHRRYRALGIALGVVVSVAVVWLVWFSPVLSVKQVRVVGADGEQSAAVLAAARIPLAVPLARIDSDGAQAAVLALPWVSSAEVRRGWPTEVVIAVEPRTAIAIDAATKKGVDASGVVFESATPLPKTLPSVKAEGVGLEAAMSVIATLPPDLAPRVDVVSATTRDDVDLVMRSGAQVHWGSADQTELKAQVLRALLRHKQEVYDVTAPELPTTFKGQ